MESDYFMVMTTINNEDSATGLAKQLVQIKLARCVQIIPRIRAIYHWDGELCDDDECLILIKTTRKNLDHLMRILPDLHPYDVPEILVSPVTSGHEPYLKWLDEWQYKESP